ncbi:hypothetical protein FPSE_06353, partial [Fusarium pseudograminearum CS3096]
KLKLINRVLSLRPINYIFKYINYLKLKLYNLFIL